VSIVRITNCPDNYDYEWTVQKSTPVPGRAVLGRPDQAPYRRVELDDRENGYYANYQIGRYHSGGYLVMTPEQWEKEIANGYIVTD